MRSVWRRERSGVTRNACYFYEVIFLLLIFISEFSRRGKLYEISHTFCLFEKSLQIFETSKGQGCSQDPRPKISLFTV